MDRCPTCNARIAWSTPEETGYSCGSIFDNITGDEVTPCAPAED